MNNFKWDKAGLKHIDTCIQKALELTGDVLQDDVREEQVVPRAVGTLQGEAFTVNKSKSKQGVVSLVFNTPYARRLYYHPEYNFRKDKNPNAQGMWMKHWMRGGKYQNRASNVMSEILRRKI